jgi:hypothetical protein
MNFQDGGNFQNGFPHFFFVFSSILNQIFKRFFKFYTSNNAFWKRETPAKKKPKYDNLNFSNIMINHFQYFSLKDYR